MDRMVYSVETTPTPSRPQSPAKTGFRDFESSEDYKLLKTELVCQKAALHSREAEVASLRTEMARQTSDHRIKVHELRTQLTASKQETEGLTEALKQRFQERERDEARRQLLQAEVGLLKSRLEDHEKRKRSQVCDAEVQTDANTSNASTAVDSVAFDDAQAALQFAKIQQARMEKELEQVHRDRKTADDSRRIAEDALRRVMREVALKPSIKQESGAQEPTTEDTRSSSLVSPEAGSSASNRDEVSSRHSTSSPANTVSQADVMSAALAVIRSQKAAALAGGSSNATDASSPSKYSDAQHFDISSGRSVASLSSRSFVTSTRDAPVDVDQAGPVDTATPDCESLAALNKVHAGETHATSAEMTLEQAPVMRERILPTVASLAHERKPSVSLSQVHERASPVALEPIVSGRAMDQGAEAEDSASSSSASLDFRQDVVDIRSARVSDSDLTVTYGTGDCVGKAKVEDVLLGSSSSPFKRLATSPLAQPTTPIVNEPLAATETCIDRQLLMEAQRARIVKEAQHARMAADRKGAARRQVDNGHDPTLSMSQSSPAIPRYCPATLAANVAASKSRGLLSLEETIRKMDRSPSPPHAHPEVKSYCVRQKSPSKKSTIVPGAVSPCVPGTVPVPVMMQRQCSRTNLNSKDQSAASALSRLRAPSPPPDATLAQLSAQQGQIRHPSPPTRGARLEDARPAAVQVTTAALRSPQNPSFQHSNDRFPLAAQGLFVRAPSPAQVRPASPPPSRSYMPMPDCHGAASFARPSAVPTMLQAPRGRQF